ncbi:unnamed protein product [Adineta ricciae]|uniref:Uncharacterized protein n=1 Tax=Adineta ricciae TaxID=249248 RepID=A0A815FII2_ADIRI|nr:unnamed protein product [Adineta ricciae]CAF1438589.1 unnamed protein product [Adineta ricciae]
MEFIRKLASYIKNFNIFPSIPPSNDEQKLRNQRISTKLFILVFIVSLFILILYNSIITVTKTEIKETPTYKQYKELDSKYSTTLNCPCKKILIDYKEILYVNFTLHQVCSSSFVTPQWIEHFFYRPIYTAQNSDDFRNIGKHLFEALTAFCDLTNRTILNSLQEFYSNQYVSATMTSLQLFLSQIRTFINQFKSMTTNTFLLSLDQILSLVQSNALISAKHTNYLLVYNSIQQIVANTVSYLNCTCDVSSTCTTLTSISKHPNPHPIFIVPGIRRGCYLVEALLQSTLECFYNQTCLNIIQYHLNYSSSSINITILDSSLPSKYSVNSTMKQMIDNLMIEQWIYNDRHENYYSQCAPIECIYSYEAKNNLLYIVTTLFGLIGGLVTALKIIIPTIVNFVMSRIRRRGRQERTPKSRIDMNQRTHPLILFKKYVNTLNLFPSIPPSNDEQKLRNQRISTKLFILVFIVSLFILILYNSIITITKTEIKETPTYKQYKELDSKYSTTLNCPCKKILIDYNEILYVNFTLHQVCSSFFVTQEWINYLSLSRGSENMVNQDFRMLGPLAFQALKSLCELASRTIFNGLIHFYSNQYFSAGVTSRELFQTHIETFIEEFKSTTTKNFLLSFDIALSMIHTNALLSARLTNYRLVGKTSPGSGVDSISKSYLRCHCHLSATCIERSTIYNMPNPAPMLFVPGFYRGCGVVEALLQSTLECFYNQTCLNRLHYFFNNRIKKNITALDATLPSNYSINSTIKHIINTLMIEKWNQFSKYDNYYSQCAPILCTYTYEAKNNLLYIVTTLFGLIGGLVTALKIIIPTIVNFVTSRIRRRGRQERTPESETNNDEQSLSILQKAINSIKTINLFPSIPPSNDEQELRNQRISTKLFILVFIVSLFILILYNSIITITKTEIKETPTYKQYKELDSKYSTTLNCPCKRILIDYKEILYVNFTLHQVCSSFFVTQDWFKYIGVHDGSGHVAHQDFRLFGTLIFQGLKASCELSNQAISSSLLQFYSNQYVSASMTSLKLFSLQIKTFIDQVKSITTNHFLISFDLIRRIIQSNDIFSGRLTNYEFRKQLFNGALTALPDSYNSCRCHTTPTCTAEGFIYQYNSSKQLFTVPGIHRGCYIVEALLQSNLKCFYSQTCLDDIQFYLNHSSRINITTLDSSLPTNYAINSTIKQMINNLMIERWIYNDRHENYYNQCAPIECIYSYETRNNLVYILTALFGLVGGLITVLKIVIPRLVAFIRWITLKCKRRKINPMS